MSGEADKGQSPETPEEKSPVQRKQEYITRIKRTLVACFMGMLTGILSYLLSGPVDPMTHVQPNALFGLLLLIAGVVFQKQVMMAIRIDSSELKTKDWAYQGFMTFALWYITWTILLST